jgi:hypothetical protein
MKKTLWAGAVGLTALGLLAGWPTRAGATMDMQKKAKAAGITVANCQHCHVDKLPKKDAHAMNDVGKWLLEEKDKRKCKEVDVTWLKDYKKP